ncbi:MAG: LysM peptidoglycan-binding domain-containing M23 family metallopeptidase [Xanthobacteraceae bacterium]|nr:LysM peptidoglycan-binding domain-containing M23 family metallopeptidase [Xanthobacteraceae bacterium]
MSRVAALLRTRRVPQIAVLALTSIGFAGCSADTSSRFSQNGYSSPYASGATGSVSPQYAPSGAVESRPLPQYSSAAPQIAPVQSYPSYSSGGGGRGVASYTPPSQPIETTGTVAPRSVAATPVPGTTIIVGTSDTIDGLARRYNVSPAAIMQANRLSGPRALQPGQQLIIPRQATASRQPAPGLAVASAPVAAPAVVAAPVAKPAVATADVHVVNRGDTLISIARRNHLSVAELAKANNLSPTAPLKIGSRITVPGKTAAAAPAAPATPPVATADAKAAPAAGTKVAQADSAPKAYIANPNAPVAEAEPAKSETTSALPTFRWPVRGRVITTYGAKTNGKQNDGINVAVPEGTPVKAAEDGVVAYSGNELKGYGNLVLIRHSNGYVTAYAHASELLVKRGETIKRGQVIAKSGQSGEVGSPQLHFEIRKGSSPVDPLQFLNGA